MLPLSVNRSRVVHYGTVCFLVELTDSLSLSLADSILCQARAVETAAAGSLAATAAPDVRLALHLLSSGNDAGAGALLETKITSLDLQRLV